MKTKKFTWADLRKAANKVPTHLLKKEVIIWAEDGEKAYVVNGYRTVKGRFCV